MARKIKKEEAAVMFGMFVKKHFRTQKVAACYFNVVQSNISKVTSGVVWPNDDMLRAMQMVRANEVVVKVDRSLPKFVNNEVK